MADMASELEAIAFRLRRAGEEDLARELNTAMRGAADPVPGRIRAGLKPKLPDAYAAVLDADLFMRVSARNSGSANANAAVTITATTRGTAERRRIRRLDQGILAHPLWGNRKHWRYQGEPSVQPGWFTRTAQDAGPDVRMALEQALRDVAAKADGAS